MSEINICNEEELKKFFKEASPEKEEFLRKMLLMQQELVKEHVKPWIEKCEVIVKLAPEDMKDKIAEIMAILSGTIAGNILMNQPKYDREQFLKQLDEMEGLMEKHKEE